MAKTASRYLLNQYYIIPFAACCMASLPTDTMTTEYHWNVIYIKADLKVVSSYSQFNRT